MVKIKREFVRAEEVIGIRNPTYDGDNVNYETARHYGLIPRITFPAPQNSIQAYEDASRKFIQKGLAVIR